MLRKIISILLIVLAIYWSFKALLPNTISTKDAASNQFSTARALEKLKPMSLAPHFLGNKEHESVRNYLVNELRALGLKPEIQEGYSMSQWGNLAKAKNILARIKGTQNTKALLLLSHYDSNPHSSLGASDAGSGIVTILEGIRAYMADGKKPKNDIIILFSDGEELGLNGADIFVNQHPWAKDVGLVLNFEARGSGGPSYMLVETNQGNSQLMKGFVEAHPEYPVANSLAYSIYKMLPNDTDLTRFREDGNIDGFNFAFIGDHFDYHTALDNFERLDRNTLEHQGSYLMPLLSYFSQADLTQLKSNDDHIYFNVPFLKTVTYPFSWIFPMLIIAFGLFLWLLIYGFRNQKLSGKWLGKGFLAFFGSLILSGGIGFFLWKLLLTIYPQYGEILHGFTYNGYTYIAAFISLAMMISFFIYSKFHTETKLASLFVAPLTFWLLICTIAAFALEGASFFIIPVYFGLLSLFIMLRQQKPNLILLALLTVPVLMIMSPFVKMFPVGLGLKILFVSCILTVMIFGLVVPVLGSIKHKNRFTIVFGVLTLWFLFSAHFNSDFSEDRPKPNSLVYLLDSDTHTAQWATYDHLLDDWTQNYISQEKMEVQLENQNVFASKYSTGLTYTHKAPVKMIPEPTIEYIQDTIINGFRNIELILISNRSAERIEVFSDSTSVFKNTKVNGVLAFSDSLGYNFSERKNNRLFSYYVSDEEPLKLSFSVPENQATTLQFYEATFDLLTNKKFTIPQRKSNMIPKPFVLNDAVIIKKTVQIN